MNLHGTPLSPRARFLHDLMTGAARLVQRERLLQDLMAGVTTRAAQGLDASQLSAYELGALLPVAYRVDLESRDAVLVRWEVEREASERQPLFTPEACADLFDALVCRRADIRVSVGALVRCPAGAPLDRLADPARVVVERLLREDRLNEPFSLLAAAGLAGLDAQAAERLTAGRGPLGVAEVELLLGWDPTQRALFAEFARESSRNAPPPLPDARERLSVLPGYAAFARTTVEAAAARVDAIHAGELPYRAEKAFGVGEKQTIGRAVRIALLRDEPWLPEPLERLVRGVAVAPTKARTLPSQGVLFEIARAAEDHPTPEAVTALRAARGLTRHAGVPKQLDRVLKRIEPALADRVEVAFRLPDGRVRETLGEHTAVIAIEGEVELSWWHGDRKLKSVPAAVKREHPDEVKRLRELAKQVRRQQKTLVRALEAGFAHQVAPPYRRLEGHPVADRLIWEFEVSPGVWRSELGLTVPDVPVRLWHPARATPDEVRAWREVVQDKELRQPFKQAFREVYLLTPAEEATATYSNRFAGHVVGYHKLYALLKQRGWQAPYLGPWDGGGDGGAMRVLGGGGWRATFLHDYLWHEDGYATTGEVRFHRMAGDGWREARLAEVPPLVFSEAMRDVDLFVAVASIGADPEWLDRGVDRLRDYWQSYGFGDLSENARVRRDALARLLPRLAIADRCALTDRFLVVRGELRTYKIHLGSGNILMEPNDAYLCVVPRGSGDRVFLPFEEDGGMLSVIVSKAFLLAADTEIADPTIVRQIRP
ncbi:DUF4132 domain-containing protein [Microbispora catharanthi]|uniref:DUF4132 domain-containing protein n=1 Tax=Microbispora catharanthi TaxID=1712871 RepID=A0A5N6BVY4_9ACTN|nr:DUF4132 domain-containing protein [Microbispora catharanthi]KAB8184607.1 DUF4132 domain-containing protein [Microbispora catharanthi]